MTKTSKKTRRDLHTAINVLSHDEVAQIIKQNFPKAQGSKIDKLAKAAIAQAHRQVSPRKTQRG